MVIADFHIDPTHFTGKHGTNASYIAMSPRPRSRFERFTAAVGRMWDRLRQWTRRNGDVVIVLLKILILILQVLRLVRSRGTLPRARVYRR